MGITKHHKQISGHDVHHPVAGTASQVSTCIQTHQTAPFKHVPAGDTGSPWVGEEIPLEAENGKLHSRVFLPGKLTDRGAWRVTNHEPQRVG